MPEVETGSAQQEHQYHQYAGRIVPWYVHMIWILYWCFAVYYTLRYVLPSIGTELLAPP
jgi:hypothetical protein